MPVLQPAEPWRKTGRLDIEELFKLTDRKGSELVLAMTHEEAVTFHIAQIVRSYRDLPLIVYHFQVKERDEARPRAGVLRTREFIMKDAYSFDRDRGGLERELRAARRRLRPHDAAHRAALLQSRGRRRHDGRHRRARVHGAVRRRRGRDRADGVRLRRQRRGRRVEARQRRARRGADRWRADRAASRRSRSATSSSSAPATPSRSARASSTRPAPSSRSGWPPTGSARRASSPPRSSSSPTSTASPGRQALAPFAVHLVVARQARHARARRRRRALRDARRRAALEVALRRSRPRPRREVRRRRAARLPAAPDRRSSLAGVGRDRGAAAPRPRRGAGLSLAGEPERLLRAVDELWQSLP